MERDGGSKWRGWRGESVRYESSQPVELSLEVVPEEVHEDMAVKRSNRRDFL
jgi:hypothetical protein